MSDRDFTAEFHAHIAKCERCARDPMMPCTFGGWLLRRAALETDIPMPTPTGAAHDE